MICSDAEKVTDKCSTNMQPLCQVQTGRTHAYVLQDLKFKYSEHGKPLLDFDQLPRRARGIDFNLTNTDGLIAVAVAAGVRVGVDCERLDRRVTFSPLRIAKKHFSPAEHAQLLGV